jgi:nitroimidazol reductase NimA-like FMN-containing flavoprotein (pyridoxamine 5'-phosphate oxidase superfamily)
MSTDSTKTKRTAVKRIPKRGAYDRETIFSILDAAFLCHVGFAVDGQPYVIPTGYGRVGDDLYIHGSAASRMLRNLSLGIEVCVTVTILDGLVLARSAFHHSMNYRSVVVLGKAELVTDAEEKLRALAAISDQIIAGRWQEVREPSDLELKATSVLRLRVDEASAKARSGPPVDDDQDYALPIWAGVVPMRLTPSEPIPDGQLAPNIGIPESVEQLLVASR